MNYSILSATYNGEKFILEQANSWFMQKYQPKQIIIADDNSQDKTLEILIGIFNKYNFKNYIILNNNYANIKKNFLYSLHNCNQDWIFFSDQDDIWESNKIEEFAKFTKNIKDNFPTLLYSDAKLIDNLGNCIKNSFFKSANLSPKVFEDDSIILKNCVQGASCAFNNSFRNLILESLEICEIEKFYMHDWWIALIAKYFAQSFFIDKTTLKYRQHNNNCIGAKKPKYTYIIEKNFIKEYNQFLELEKFCNYKKIKFSKTKLSLKYVPKLKKIIFNLQIFLN